MDREKIRFVDPHTFHKLAQDNAAHGVGIRKSFTPEIKQESDSERLLTFTISTGRVDRDRDTIDPNTWELTDFRRNPVVTWCHDYHTPPVARAIETYTTGQALKSRASFVPPDLADHDHVNFADMVYQMLLKQFLNAASVGFYPDEWSYAEERNGINFKRQTLLEYAIVVVPANPEALIEARSAGIDTAPLKVWAEKILDTLKEKDPEWVQEKGLWLPRSEVEALSKAADPKQKTIVRISPSLTVVEEQTTVGEEKTEEIDREIEYGTPPAEETKTGEAKQGRVLSKRNEERIRTAVNALSEVLAEIEGMDEEEEEEEDEKAIVTAALEAARKQDGFVVQTLIFPKDKWSLADARKWARDHDYKADEVDETEVSYRFRQREPGDFERLRTICMNPGTDTPPDSDGCRVKAVGGPLKSVEDAVAKTDLPLFAKLDSLTESIAKLVDVLATQPAQKNGHQNRDPTPEENGDLTDEEIKRLVQNQIGEYVMRLTGRVPDRV